MAHRDKAYAIVLTPDCMLSDGSVARLQDLAAGGAELVLCATLRFAEEPFFANLRQSRAIPDEKRQDSGKPLSLSGRQLASAALNALHDETLTYEWDAPYFTPLPSAAWWRVPGEEGIVVHSLSWAMLLLDYHAVQEHDTTALESWTIDGDYVARNFDHPSAIYVVRDSDEMFIASWGPAAQSPQNFNYRHLGGEWGKGVAFRAAFNGPVFDPLKRRIFFLPVRWHSRTLNEHWRATERRALRTLITFVTPPDDLDKTGSSVRISPFRGDSQIDDVGAIQEEVKKRLGAWRWRPVRALWYGAITAIGFVARIDHVAQTWRFNGRGARHRIGKALQGDRAAQRWVMWRIRVLIGQIFGRQVHLPMPPLPD